MEVVVPALGDGLLYGQEKRKKTAEAVTSEVDLRGITPVAGGVLVDVSKHKSRVVDLGVYAPW